MTAAHAPLAAAFLLALSGCATSGAARFDIASLAPTTEGELASLTGHFVLSGLQFRLYPGAAGSSAPCLSGALTSLAGVPPPAYANRTMTLSGRLLASSDPEASSIPNACNSKVLMLATEVVTP
jgi:hypothetical protein